MKSLVNNRNLAQLVERLPYTQNVIGSNPVVPTRSMFNSECSAVW